MPIEKRRYTIGEYLVCERSAHEKHEYRDGEILAMAGGSYRHSLILANLIGELGNALKGKPCRALESNLRVRIPRTPLYTYPDASVICGEPKFDPNDEALETITNPRVVLEVLSPSTEAYDRGEKFARYRQLESLEAYVLISQDVPRVELFLWQSDGTWLFRVFSGMEARVELAGLGIELPLAEIYAGVAPAPESQSG
jgi:Uma2 family endonuclease